MKIRKVDHVGIVVNDLAAAKEFFLDLGLELEGEAPVGGEWVDRVVGLKDVRAEIAMLQTPDGQMRLELSKFHSPAGETGSPHPLANTPGIRHIAFVVDDVDAIVAKLKSKDVETFGEVQNYENIYKLCYVRGPEGIILELAEELE